MGDLIENGHLVGRLAQTVAHAGSQAAKTLDDLVDLGEVRVGIATHGHSSVRPPGALRVDLVNHLRKRRRRAMRE